MTGGITPAALTADAATAIESDLAGSSSAADAPPVGCGHDETVRPERTPLVGGSLSPKRFALALAGVVLGALALRIAYVLAFTRYQNGTLYDSFWYYSTTIGLHSGQFFRAPFSFNPTAAHPPMTTLLLAAGAFVIGLHGGTTSSLLVMAVLGSGVVLCVGLVGRALAGPWVGLTAAVLAALAPNFWMPSGILMSETPAMLFMALILLAVMHVRRSPTVAAAVLLGVACGAEALVRAELVLLVPGLLIPATLIARIPLHRRFLLLGVGLATTTLVLAPWVGRNLATFKDPTYLSTGNGLVLSGANCQQTYGGPDLGLWSVQCAKSVRGGGDESMQSAREQHAGVQYIEHHADRLPMVMLVRIAREWDLYEPVQMAQVEAGEGRPVVASLAGLGFYYFLLPFGVAGIVILRRRRIDQWFLVVPAAIVTLVSGLFYALVRFRAPFEVCLVILAAPAIVLLIERVPGLGASDRARSGLRSTDSSDSPNDHRGLQPDPGPPPQRSGKA
jgi:4-amino-4-deoxy-L-arabinose transferase-like glycosyltransferase